MSFFRKYRWPKILGIIAFLLIAGIFAFRFAVVLNPPEVVQKDPNRFVKDQPTRNFSMVGNSWLKQNNYGLWEMYIAGKPYERGYKNGMLTQKLINYQEVAFVEFIKQLVPSDNYLNFLKYFVAWFNKNMDKHIPTEYQKEIYGISQFASNEFDFIAPNYQRLLNYHGAHDIGHTLQNLNLVGCTAFGVKGSASADSSLLIGRNMDFYSGDKFAENKIVAFYHPDKGHNFAFVTWGGMIGVLSGMNDQGLTVSLNAAKSSIPFAAKTPVSILARKIVQYASTISEAYEIAKNHETFVAESFFIASAKDNQMAVIEKSTSETHLYTKPGDRLILTNHFQSDALKRPEVVNQPLKNHPSLYRWERTAELLNQQEKHTVQTFANILRDQKGLHEENIGMGNEKAVNQLIAHHSVIFKPQTLQMWVAAPPYQLGKYMLYDLKKIFSDTLNPQHPVPDTTGTIAEDAFLHSADYKNYLAFKKRSEKYEKMLNAENIDKIDQTAIKSYLQLNPEYYYGYFLAGELFNKAGDAEKAHHYYKKALKKEIPYQGDREKILEKIEKLKR